MTDEWDVDDRNDWRDFQDEAASDRYLEAKHEADLDKADENPRPPYAGDTR